MLDCGIKQKNQQKLKKGNHCTAYLSYTRKLIFLFQLCLFSYFIKTLQKCLNFATVQQTQKVCDWCQPPSHQQMFITQTQIICTYSMGIQVTHTRHLRRSFLKRMYKKKIYIYINIYKYISVSHNISVTLIYITFTFLKCSESFILTQFTA